VLLLDKNEEKAIFTGDTLFAGDCGRPDLREVAGKIHSKREELATLMYHSLRDKLLILPDHVQVYPGHGAGSLCGKNINPDSVSTIGKEKRFNWCLQPMSEDEFILRLLNEQPFIPAYFAYDVELNIIGATALKTAIRNVKRSGCLNMAVSRRLDTRKWIVDGRDAHLYRCGHFAHSINLMENGSFETWLGTLIQPGEMFCLAATDQDQLERLILRAANIGYENQIQEAFTLESAPIVAPLLDKQDFLAHPGNYTIVDVREPSERRQRIPFSHSLSIPLSEMQTRVNDIITEKPIVVHCSGGYRSAAASSFMQSILDGNTVVYDLGPAIREVP
jgi:rhodanese-related sulfurtransferase